jgi:rRNA maturation protein Rpf1
MGTTERELKAQEQLAALQSIPPSIFNAMRPVIGMQVKGAIVDHFKIQHEKNPDQTLDVMLEKYCTPSMLKIFELFKLSKDDVIKIAKKAIK